MEEKIKKVLQLIDRKFDNMENVIVDLVNEKVNNSAESIIEKINKSNNTIDASKIRNLPESKSVTKILPYPQSGITTTFFSLNNTVIGRAKNVNFKDGSALGIVMQGDQANVTIPTAGGGITSLNGDSTPAQALVAGSGISITPGPAGTNTITNTSLNSINYTFTKKTDEFYGNPQHGINSIGELNWGYEQSGVFTAPAGSNGSANHPGVVVMSVLTNAVDGLTKMKLNNELVLADCSYIAAIVKPLTITNAGFRFGLLVSDSGLGEADWGVYFSYDSATNSHWRTITQNSIGITANTTTVTYADQNYFLLEIKRNGSSFEFYINTVLQFTHSTNIAGLGSVFPDFVLETTDTNRKDMYVDWFQINTINPLGQRWT